MKTLIAIVVLLCSLPLSANDRAAAIRDLRALPFEVILEERSQPGEVLDLFMLRVAPVLRAHTLKTGHEACGVVAEDESGYAIVVGSSGAAAACINDRTRVPEGFVASDLTIHSHPESPTLRLSRIDRAIMGLAARASGGAEWGEAQGPRSLRVQRAMPNSGLMGFSDADFGGGPGYLVAGGRLLRQDGREAVHVVGSVEP